MYDAAQEILKTITENERSAVSVLDLRVSVRYDRIISLFYLHQYLYHVLVQFVRSLLS